MLNKSRSFGSGPAIRRLLGGETVYRSMPRLLGECDRPAQIFRESVRRRLALAEFGEEPGSGERPVTIGGAANDAQGLGRLVEGQAREEAEFDQFGTGRIFLRQFFQGIVEEEKVVRRFRDGEIDVV